MNVAGIVAEYNPFHNGHRYHIEQTRKALGGDCAVICVMSGNFVQRGECAWFSKFARARIAALCGVDLVIELPIPWALSSAGGFARGAVGLLADTGVVTHLSFGSEAGDISLLEKSAQALLLPEMDELIKAELSLGRSYAAARQSALQSKLGDEARLIREPNNILAVEYLKAIYDLRVDIKPLTVSRSGAGHDELSDNSMPSASQLRLCLSQGRSIRDFVPEAANEIIEREISSGRGPVMPENLEIAVLSRLRMLPEEAYGQLPDSSEGLGNRLYSAVRSCNTLDSILAEAKTKRYAMSRLRRMLMCAALGITADMNFDTPQYLRVLAANEKGRGLLSEMQAKARVDVLTKPAAVRKLSRQAQRLFELEAASTDLHVLGYAACSERRAGSDWRSSPAMV